MSVTAGQPIAYSDMAALATLANGKSVLAKDVSPMYLNGAAKWGHRRFYEVAIDPTNPGTGYKAGDVLSLGFGSQFSVALVSATGAVRAIRIVNHGAGTYADPTWNGTTGTQIANSGGSGTGCQLLYSSFSQYGPTADYDFGTQVAGVSIPDYDPTIGRLTGVYLVDGGTGYAAGNTLTIAEIPEFSIAVNTVDGPGKILTYTLTLAGSPTTIYAPQNVASMAAVGGAGSGAKFGAYVTLAQKPKWLTELNRLRGDVYLNTSGNTGITSYQKLPSCSAPAVGWPKSGKVGAGGFNPSSDYQEFYFEDTGAAETITLSATAGLGQSLDGWAAHFPYNAYYYELTPCPIPPYPSFPNYNCVTAITYKVRIKCPVGSTFSGRFLFQAYSGSTDYNSGTILTSTAPSLSISSDLGVFHPVNTGGDSWDYICDVSGLGSKDYYVTVTGGSISATINGYDRFGNPTFAIEYLTIGPYAITGAPVPLRSTGGAFSSVVYSAVETNGVHNSKKIFKIPIPLHGTDMFLESGLGVCPVGRFPNGQYPAISYPSSIPPIDFKNISSWSQELFGPPNAGMSFSYTLTISNGTTGYWVGTVAMVSNLNVVTPAKMPWNLQRTKYGSSGSATVNPMLLGNLAPTANTARVSNSYDQTLPVESQTELPARVSSRYYTAGFRVMSNYCVLEVTTAGTTGTVFTPPDSSVPVGSTNTDGTVVWTLKTNPLYPGSTDKLWTTAVHRPQSIPRYPVYWASETIARMKPPASSSESDITIWGAGNQWQRNVYHSPSFNTGWQEDNLAKGWWIYSVSFNRMKFVIKSAQTSGNNGVLSAASADEGAGASAASASGIQSPATDGEVSVTIGCMRSGAFVAFGTYTTGQTIQVLWPIFTSDALVYQCAERVDIQAVAIASGGVGVSTGATANGYPICAAFVSDTTKLLNLL